jgi:mono/diheme cytochrome c family protein
VLAAGLLILGAALLPGCQTTGDDDTQTAVTGEARTSQQPADAGRPLSPAEEHGRTLFVQTCGSCHTLDAAGTIGQIGPDLGDIPLDEAEVLKAIEIGGRATGNMPPHLYEGKDARDIAKFVAGSGPGV